VNLDLLLPLEPIEKLRKIGKKAFLIALSEAAGTFIAGYIVGQYALGFSFFDSLFLALAISVTSTVIVMRVLEELGMIKDESSVLILGVPSKSTRLLGKSSHYMFINLIWNHHFRISAQVVW
jgi:hypothetical protein